MSVASPEELEPLYFGLDTLFWIHVKLFVQDVYQLRTHSQIPEVYLYSNHPIRKVAITGLVVEKDEKTKYVKYVVDDGTGYISCISWFSDEEQKLSQRETIDLGSLVTVYGRISVFRDVRQISVNGIVTEKDPNVEPYRWLEILQLKKTVYDIPFELTEELKAEAEQVVTASLADAQAREEDSNYAENLEKLRLDLEERTPTEADVKEFAKLMILTNDWINIPYRLLRYDDTILALVDRILRAVDPTIEPTLQKVNNLLTRVVTSLVKECFMFLHDEDEDVYQVVRYDVNLRGAILDLLPTDSQSSINHEVMIFQMRQTPNFKMITRTVFEKAILQLVEEGVIYECGFKEYKIFKPYIHNWDCFVRCGVSVPAFTDSSLSFASHLTIRSTSN